jgi:hypothetical protein
MTSEEDRPPRLGAVAALVDLDPVASREANAWIGLEGQQYSENEAELVMSATAGEWLLADALRGPPGMEVPEPDEEAIARLLRLAESSPQASVLAIGLCQKFLIPDDSWYAPACSECAAEFADLYRTLALPGMPAEATEQAMALLHDLC